MNSIIVMTRKQLYTEIWELSVAGVARKYNLNYSRLIKQCREENIPFPSSGYWTRKNIGKDVSSEVVILNGDPDKKLSVLTKDATVTRFKGKHELTKQEAKELVKYNDEIKRNHWASKPKIRQYDYYYNGKMRIIIDGNYIRENASKPLETSLGDMLICIYKKSEEHRIAREKREEQERIWQEERRREQEQKERKAKEFEKTIQLENMAEDYRIAKDIRAFIQAKTAAGNTSAEWIKWANAKADWYDPTLNVQDELLGKRDHEKSKEEKRKSMEQNSKYWRWY